MHHICSIQLRFPPKNELQFALEHHRAISDPWLHEKKITDIFANALADRQRSPIGIRMNVHLLLRTHADEIPPECRRDLLNRFTTVLTDIATEYTDRQNLPPL